MAAGILVTIGFHFVLHEPDAKQIQTDNGTDCERESENSLIEHDEDEFVAKKWYDWFLYTPTYVMATVFLLARMANNTFGTYGKGLK